jgi:hypothetical protein
VKYADRYANEDFWRIPGGKPGVWITCVIGMASTIAGIYYSFASPWIDVPKGTWMTWLGSIVAGTLVVMALVYVFGRRSAAKLNQEDALAHLAKLDLSSEAPEAVLRCRSRADAEGADRDRPTGPLSSGSLTNRFRTRPP